MSTSNKCVGDFNLMPSSLSLFNIYSLESKYLDKKFNKICYILISRGVISVNQSASRWYLSILEINKKFNTNFINLSTGI